MQIVCEKNKLNTVLYDDLNSNKTGLSLTLNGFTKDSIKLEEDARELLKRLNSFCYGRQFKRKERALRAVGVIEKGNFNQGLHIHMIIMHKNDTSRDFATIERFIRGEWYSIINAKQTASKYGNLVNLKPVFDLEGIITYITKTYYHEPHQLNPFYG